MPRIWLITGCSSGFGKEIALAAVAAGDTVVATARSLDKMADLQGRAGIHLKQLDVTASDAETKALVDDVEASIGPIDVLVNNAGYILCGGIEECSNDEVVQQFATNVFGQFTLIRAVAPHMRARRRGVITNLGSIGGWYGTAAAGMYCATKAAIAIYTESLALELEPYGITVTCIEPGYFRTNFLDAPSGRKTTAQKQLPDTREGTGAVYDMLDSYNHAQPGDPVKGARVIVQALTGAGPFAGKKLPLRLLLGKDAVKLVGEVMERQRRDFDEWKYIISGTNHDDVVD